MQKQPFSNIVSHMHIMVETISGQLGHVLAASNGTDPVYKTSRSDQDSAFGHVH